MAETPGKTPGKTHDKTPPTASAASRELPALPSLLSLFPLSLASSCRQWWHASAHSPVGSTTDGPRLLRSPEQAEQQHRILSRLPFFPEPSATHCAEIVRVGLTGAHRVLNEFRVSPRCRATTDADGGSEPPPPPLVMLHGYGAGLCMFYRSFAGLAAALRGRDIVALDLLGMGLSSRPRFRLPPHLDGDARVDAAEAFFIDALEEWRERRGHERIVLLGHSLGGYLAAIYALRHPERLADLILVSPVGIPQSPYEPGSAHLLDSDTPPKPPPRLPGWLRFLWEQNISPFAFCRIPILGPKFASAWTSRRFHNLPPDESRDMHSYAYEIFRQRGSGEFALGSILAPGAYARRPLVNRMHELASALKRGCCRSVSFVYGDSDWMDVKSGTRAAALLESEGISSHVHVVPHAGHNLFLDNPQSFNEHLANILNH